MSTSSPDVFPGAKLVQLKEWGYPMGQRRYAPSDDKAFSVIHITGNARLPSAENEAAWRLNDPGLQNSATFFVNRDGSVVQCLVDPLHMAPWANGDVNGADMSNRRIAQVVADGINANQRTLVAIENVGYEPGYGLTDAQVRSCAAIIRYYHGKAGVAINRITVVGHYQLNSVTRANCPARDKTVIDRIVAAAQEAGGLPDTSTGEDPAVIEELKSEVSEWKQKARKYWQWILGLRARRDELLAEVDALEAQLAAIPDAATVEEYQATIKKLRGRLNGVKQKVTAMAADVSDD